MNRMVHPTPSGVERTRRAHERFLAFNLLTGVGALALLPLYLASHIPPVAQVLNLFMIYSLNIFLALAVSRTGEVRPAAHVHAIAMSWGLVALCLSTGGMTSFALPLLLILPLTGALLGDRDVLSWQIGAAGTAMLLLFIADAAGLAINPAFQASIFGLGADAFAMICAVAQVALFAALPAEGAPAAVEQDEAPEPVDLEPVLDLCILSLDRNGATLDVRGARTLGLPQGRKLTLETLRQRLHLHDLPPFMKAVSDCLHGGQMNGDQQVLDVRLQLSPGIWTPFRAVVHPCGENGAAAALVSFRNVSEQQARRQELEAALKAADQASHTKSRFLSSVSHELRTPLNAVIGFSDILSEEHFGTIDQRQVREYARIIRDSGQNLLHFVNQIIDLSKIESGSFDLILEPFDAGPVLRSVVEEFRPEMDAKHVRAQLDIAADLGELTQDRRAFARVVKQILSNAVKFSPEGGCIYLSARPEWRGVKVVVKDEGPGIPRGAEGEMLEPFARINASSSIASEGAGLGLTLAKGLIELQGGSLRFDAADGVGTTVEINFPSREGNLLSLGGVTGEAAAPAGAVEGLKATKTG